MSNPNDFEFAKRNETNNDSEASITKKSHVVLIIAVVFISLLLPMIGFAVYLKWRAVRPLDAKYPGYATIVSVAFGYTLLFYWIFILN